MQTWTQTHSNENGGLRGGGGGEDSCKRKRSQTRVQKCTLFFEKIEKKLLPAFSKVWSSTLTAQCERRVCSKAPGSQNGVYSLKWRLTDRYLRWGTLAGPRPGRADADHCKSSDFLQELRISGFPRFWVSPTCISREIKMNRRHYENVSWSSFHAAQAEYRKRTELVFRVEAKFFETWPKRNHVKKRARFS